MAKRGRKPVLDDVKKREILAILTVGCSRRTAASYVGCTHPTIRNTAERDPDFAEALRRAEYKAEIGYVKNIQNAARKEQYWRAAAWALERLNPEDFALKNPAVITADQIAQLMVRIAEAISEEVPSPRHTGRILKRLDAIIADLSESSTQTMAHHEK